MQGHIPCVKINLTLDRSANKKESFFVTSTVGFSGMLIIAGEACNKSPE